jgi:metallo-beta-lactamase family protein
MCAGERVVNYLKAMLGDPRHDILFVGYQAEGTPGRAIQRYGPRGGYVDLDGKRYDIRAAVHTLTGCPAHADQGDLVAFIAGIQAGPRRVVLVHGEAKKKQALAQALRVAPGDAEAEVAYWPCGTLTEPVIFPAQSRCAAWYAVAKLLTQVLMAACRLSQGFDHGESRHSSAGGLTI